MLSIKKITQLLLVFSSQLVKGQQGYTSYTTGPLPVDTTSFPGEWLPSGSLPAGSMPNPPVGTIPYHPVGSIPNPPAGSYPYPPVGSIPEQPFGSIPNPPVGSIPAEGKTIYSDDPIIAKQGQYMDMLMSLQDIFSHMSPQDAIEKAAKNPHFQTFLQPSPLELNNIIKVLDRHNDEVLASYDWDKIHQDEFAEFEKNLDKFSTTTGSMDQQWDDLLKSGKVMLSSKHRNLEVATAVAVGTAVLPIAVEGIIEFVKYAINADKEISDYTAIYQQIANVEGVGAKSVELLNQAEDYATKARSQLREAFLIVKAAALDLQSYLQGHQIHYWDMHKLMEGSPYQAVLEQRQATMSKTYILEFRKEIDIAGNKVDKSRKYVKEGTEIVTDVKESLNKEKKALKANAEGKSRDFEDYQAEQRGIAYGTCTGVTIVSFGTGSACFIAAAAILETKLNDYRDRNEKMERDVAESIKNIDSVLDRADDIQTDLNDCSMRVTKLDEQIKQWAKMTNGAEAMDGISEDKEKYDEIMGTLQKVQMDEDYQMTLA